MVSSKKRKFKLSKKQKRILLIAAACLLVLAACYTLFLAPLLREEKWIFKETTVEKGTLVMGITESGQLEYGVQSVTYDLDLSITDAEESEDEEETVSRYLEIERVYVAAGQRIQKGDSLIAFSKDSIEDVRKLLNSALADAKVARSEAQSEYDLAVLEAQSDYKAKTKAAEYAKETYSNTKATIENEILSLQLQITKSQNQVESLEDNVDTAQENFNEAEQAYLEAKNSLEQADPQNAPWYRVVLQGYNSARTKYDNALSSLDRAKQSLSDNGVRITKLQTQLANAKAAREINNLTAEENYQTALLEGENAAILYDAELESLKSTLEEAQSKEQEISEQINAFETFVGEKGILYAEESGIVTEMVYEAGDELVNKGTILSYATMDAMTISVDVTQEDVVDLKVGDKVDILFSAYGEKEFGGTILEIDTTATSRNSNTVSYPVLIGVEGETTLLYGGMTADITFAKEKKDDVLYVSRNAVVEENGKSYVYIRQDKNARKQVETGLRNGVYVEILSGLEKGDVIYIASVVSSLEDVEKQQDKGSATQDGNSGFSPENFMNGNMDFGDMEFPGGMEMPDMGNMPGGGMPDIGNMPGGGMPDMSGRPGGNEGSGSRGPGRRNSQ
ncbi:MAG: HlyD family efflux transporter periplasmic adaptor subunit [Lachnospiraceae bacterium]|nr:HlyD family efflux transporter periplasmic adaptor subunit [Lachnospiraceae bacterium]